MEETQPEPEKAQQENFGKWALQVVVIVALSLAVFIAAALVTRSIITSGDEFAPSSKIRSQLLEENTRNDSLANNLPS